MPSVFRSLALSACLLGGTFWMAAAWGTSAAQQANGKAGRQQQQTAHTHDGDHQDNHSHTHGHGPGQHTHDHEGTEEIAAQTPQFPPAIILPEFDGPKPWTDKPHLNDPDRFQIAIMTDRTGGHRPGIWESAVSKLNLLRPEFVMSVGDLIEGYSEDRNVVEGQWQEFLGFMDKMEMKFFFVSGNHDVTNPLMHKIWREHFGAAWYSFDYKGVHFICLCSEDPETHIGDEQLAWLKSDAAEHADARWTLVFLHKPLWTEMLRSQAAGNADTTNWGEVEKLLADRPHTVFSGHQHHYVQHDRNGQKYYQLATTGGSSGMRGVPYGEFDHVAWLTMEKDGPHVANLLLSGILPADVVTQESGDRFRRFLAQSQIEIAPILVDDAAGLSEGVINIRFTNGFDSPVQVTGDIAGLPLRGITVEPVQLELSAAPGETTELSVGIRFTEPVAFSHFAGTVFNAKLKSADDPPLSAEVAMPVVVDQRYAVPRRMTEITLDGELGDWDALPLATAEQPLVAGAAGNWQGPGDASAKFGVSTDDEFVYLAARVTDDRVLDNDALEFRLDSRPNAVRVEDSRFDLGKFRFTIPVSGNFQAVDVDNSQLSGAKAELHKTDGGYTVELAVPAALLDKAYGSTWRDFQLTVIVLDVDAANEKSANVVWRGTRNYATRNTNFGQFVREQ